MATKSKINYREKLKKWQKIYNVLANDLTLYISSYFPYNPKVDYSCYTELLLFIYDGYEKRLRGFEPLSYHYNFIGAIDNNNWVIRLIINDKYARPGNTILNLIDLEPLVIPYQMVTKILSGPIEKLSNVMIFGDFVNNVINKIFSLDVEHLANPENFKRGFVNYFMGALKNRPIKKVIIPFYSQYNDSYYSIEMSHAVILFENTDEEEILNLKNFYDDLGIYNLESLNNCYYSNKIVLTKKEINFYLQEMEF